jgi:hypothetical protein
MKNLLHDIPLIFQAVVCFPIRHLAILFSKPILFEPSINEGMGELLNDRK